MHLPFSVRPRRLLLPALVVLTAALASSCQKQRREPVVPVTGSVSLRGRPAEGVRMAFHPSRDPGDRRLRPQAIVAADGSFRLTTYTAGDGAPPGTYFVTLYWPAPGPDDDVHVHPDRLGDRYTNPKTTPLTATVPAEAVALDRFELK